MEKAAVENGNHQRKAQVGFKAFLSNTTFSPCGKRALNRNFLLKRLRLRLQAAAGRYGDEEHGKVNGVHPTCDDNTCDYYCYYYDYCYCSVE